MGVTIGWSRARQQWVPSAWRHLCLVLRDHALCSSRGCDDAAQLTVCSATTHTCLLVAARSWVASSAFRSYHLACRSRKPQ